MIRLYDLRMAAGLSPDELGTEAGVSGDTIRNLEKGESRPHAKTASKLITYFSKRLDREVTASELFGESERLAA